MVTPVPSDVADKTSFPSTLYDLFAAIFKLSLIEIASNAESQIINFSIEVEPIPIPAPSKTAFDVMDLAIPILKSLTSI